MFTNVSSSDLMKNLSSGHFKAETKRSIEIDLYVKFWALKHYDDPLDMKSSFGVGYNAKLWTFRQLIVDVRTCKRKEDNNHSVVGTPGGSVGAAAAAAAALAAVHHVSSVAGSVAPTTVTHLNASKNQSQTKKPRLVFTDLQRRTLQAIFKETKRPSKEMQIAISQQLGLELSTVGNFFMNARRRSQDKWLDDSEQQQIKRDTAAAAAAAAASRPPSELHQQSQQGAAVAGGLKGISGTPAGLLHSHATSTAQPVVSLALSTLSQLSPLRTTAVSTNTAMTSIASIGSLANLSSLNISLAQAASPPDLPSPALTANSISNTDNS
ncbi:ONECUT DNA binding protein-like [Tropilaelaps mercedesae]|uniref:ONECUT DNA binding protein-like n=1 Tax=Tropilaelaps mercedesae TaxID=418985 RepID=A0A1V9XRG7_9ACAR|nr:ONECUT DNA binding protein-like [Tropilaelaps mercedesae]